MIMLKRNWLKDRKHIDEAFGRFKKYPVPIWLITFLEGSRRTEKKLRESQDYAKKNDLPILKHVLLPRTKGFVATIETLRNSHVKYVYDLTIDYGGDSVPSIYDVYDRAMPEKKVHVHVRRFPIDSLPHDPEELSRWCFRIWKEKDDMIEKLKSTGSYAGPKSEYAISSGMDIPSIQTWIVICNVSWFLLVYLLLRWLLF